MSRERTRRHPIAPPIRHISGHRHIGNRHIGVSAGRHIGNHVRRCNRRSVHASEQEPPRVTGRAYLIAREAAKMIRGGRSNRSVGWPKLTAPSRPRSISWGYQAERGRGGQADHGGAANLLRQRKPPSFPHLGEFTDKRSRRRLDHQDTSHILRLVLRHRSAQGVDSLLLEFQAYIHPYNAPRTHAR